MIAKIDINFYTHFFSKYYYSGQAVNSLPGRAVAELHIRQIK
jgi:hypothetical protein